MQLTEVSASDVTASAIEFTTNATSNTVYNKVSTPPEKLKIIEPAQNWSSAFNTSILATRLDPTPIESELETLLATPEYSAIIFAAQCLAEKLNISAEEATERLIQKFRGIDACWEKILLKKGAQSLLGIK